MPPTSSSTSSTELQISVGTGPQPRASDLSGHRQTSTASSRSQWALPDLNRELQSSQRALDLNCERQMSVGTPRPQRRAPDVSRQWQTSTASARCQIECHKDRQIECQNIYARMNADRMSEYMSDRMPDNFSARICVR